MWMENGSKRGVKVIGVDGSEAAQGKAEERPRVTGLEGNKA